MICYGSSNEHGILGLLAQNKSGLRISPLSAFPMPAIRRVPLAFPYPCLCVHTAEKLFGHSQAMTRRYYKPTMSVLREAVDVLERKKA